VLEFVEEQNMYATLPLKRLLAVLIWPFGIVLVFLILIQGVPKSPTISLRMIGTATTIWGFVLLVVAGSSGKWSPWRMLWYFVPGLNRWAFPDLNGVWVGKTSSNWPVIKTKLDAATGPATVQESELATIPLLDGTVAITIVASFFTFRLSAKLESTGGKSYSLTARVCKDEQRDLHDLYYVYRQETSEPRSSDEASHLGAAALEINCDNWSMDGQYWTKRRWRSGLNTAGLINVSRISR
jgi:hypothetical protein